VVVVEVVLLFLVLVAMLVLEITLHTLVEQGRIIAIARELPKVLVVVQVLVAQVEMQRLLVL
jgi:hypothetical protein